MKQYECWCYNCLKNIKEEGQLFPVAAYTFIVCPNCGNKRCPKATDHNQFCAQSNTPNQPGSRY